MSSAPGACRRLALALRSCSVPSTPYSNPSGILTTIREHRPRSASCVDALMASTISLRLRGMPQATDARVGGRAGLRSRACTGSSRRTPEEGSRAQLEIRSSRKEGAISLSATSSQPQSGLLEEPIDMSVWGTSIPPTEPSFVPCGPSSSMPTHVSEAKRTGPTKRTTPRWRSCAPVATLAECERRQMWSAHDSR